MRHVAVRFLLFSVISIFAFVTVIDRGDRRFRRSFRAALGWTRAAFELIAAPAPHMTLKPAHAITRDTPGSPLPSHIIHDQRHESGVPRRAAARRV